MESRGLIRRGHCWIERAVYEDWHLAEVHRAWKISRRSSNDYLNRVSRARDDVIGQSLYMLVKTLKTGTVVKVCIRGTSLIRDILTRYPIQRTP